MMKLKKLILIGLVSFLCINSSIDMIYCKTNSASMEETFQYDKEQIVSLTKDYNRCVFEIKFDEKGDYAAILLNKDKKQLSEFSVIAEDTLSTEIASVKKGDYYIQIVNKDESGELPHTKITVSAATKNSTSVVDNIKVGKDISGLKIYFKNSAIVAEWNDETVGDVNIKVVNLDTAETIINTKVSGYSYECPLDENVKNLTISVVPASSAGINGAGQTFNYEVNYNPLAVVTYDDVDYCNADYTNVTVELKETYNILITNNDVNVVIEENVNPGTYSISIPLTEEGVNRIKTYIVDDIGNMKSTDVNIIKDTVGPVITFDKDYSNITVAEKTISITGSIVDFKDMDVNGYPVEVATDGTFVYPCSLHLGENDITVSACDFANNVVHYDMKITYVEEIKKEFPIKELLKSVAYIACLVGLIVYFVISRKKKKNDTKKKEKE